MLDLALGGDDLAEVVTLRLAAAVAAELWKHEQWLSEILAFRQMKELEIDYCSTQSIHRTFLCYGITVVARANK